MITVKNLTFHYRGKNHLYRDFSLHIERGRIYGLLGSNGVGKSTLLKLMCGLLSPDSGEVELFGHRSRARSVSQLADIFVVPEEFELPKVTLGEFARLTAPFYPSFDHSFFADALRRFEVGVEEEFHSMSMGQRKKAYIAFAMAAKSSLLLLDEPTNGLDITSKATFRSLLAEWATPERTAIISTHQVREVANMFDHIVIIDPKGLVVDSSVYDLSSRLKFSVESSAEGALYSQSTLGGYATVRENVDGEESNPDIELLFGAATTSREEIIRILNPSTNL